MDHVISYLSRWKAVPAGLWHHEVKQSYDLAAVFEEQLKKCGMGERSPSARFAGTSPFRGGFLTPTPPQKESHVRSTSFPAAPSLPKHRPVVENGTFSTTGRS